MGYCHPILADCDNSSIIIACHQRASTLLEEERQRYLPINLQLAAAELCDRTLEDVLLDPQWM
jgi:hypothetical protein